MGAGSCVAPPFILQLVCDSRYSRRDSQSRVGVAQATAELRSAWTGEGARLHTSGGASPCGQPRAAIPTWALAFHKSCEHALWIDRDEQALTAGQHFPFSVQDLGHIDVLPALHFNFARLNAQRLLQWHRLQVVHGNLGSQRHHLTQLVHLAHRFIEDGCDDAAVAVAGRSGVALAQAKSAYETVALLVIGEAQAHTVGVILAAGEAIVLLQPDVRWVVPAPPFLAGHPQDS